MTSRVDTARVNPAMMSYTPAPQLLASAVVYIRDRERNPIKCRALLDTCATANLISESILKRLNIHVSKGALSVGMINDVNTESRGIVRVTMQSMHDNYRRDLTCLVIPVIADLIPSEVFPRETIELPSNVRLADPNFHLPRAVDLLIGSGLTLSLFSVGQINLSRENHDLYLQKTRLGWVVVGGVPSQAPKSTCYMTNLENQLNKFWAIEEVRESKKKSDEQIDCEAHFERTVSRDADGRYKVCLPFRKSNTRLGESRSIALKRLLSLERKFKRCVKKRVRASNRGVVFAETLHHTSAIEDPDDDGYYLPHHAVIKEASNTTKVRVVFDASAKTNNGISLNDALMVGPTIQDTLFSHLIRFRTYNYVVTADIEKMYRQLLLHGDDRRYQRFLWRVDGRIKTFQLNTFTFGVSPSSFLAIRVLQKLAEDERHVYPRAAEILTTHLYVDDLLSGADTIVEARAVRDEMIALLKRDGFSIRQWASNDERVINDLASNALHTNLVLNVDRSVKTLGITWNTRDDQMHYAVRSIEITQRLTKRNILSEIAKIFDPIGLLGPIILYAKRLLQDIWRSGLQWDESVPQDIYTEFCDASSIGYGACLYVRSSRKNETAIVRLACAKSRVAPLKPITIPRLELCGALVLAQLYREASAILNVTPNRVIFWCDSTIVLHWIKTPSHLLKTFIANRVTEIQNITGSNVWWYVQSEDNPADALSRGQLSHTFLRNKMWLTGPSWLVEDESEWPNEIMQTDIEITELKKTTCLIAATHDTGILTKYSFYSKLLRIIAYCLRFRRTIKSTGSLSASEIIEAEQRILRILQASQFANEIKELKLRGSTNKSKSPI
ncbi:PREDICTED: uncharacterized protein LOC105557255 [Vollenhovia emeryi]|uniref:uncharacterized protein LOC105557255 n=1 Tax=Vollenhovia emeryi TaxID=411798 RepID=UPI0005F514BF|nr:PREDICTED: uncharacterized protein LOC105557255 [Vollenhovia emeryi]